MPGLSQPRGPRATPLTTSAPRHEGVNQREIVARVYGDNAVVTRLFTRRGPVSGVMTDRLVFNEVIPVLPRPLAGALFSPRSKVPQA